MDNIEHFKAMLAAGQDNALLRLSLGTACSKAGDYATAITHLAKAIEFDPEYSAAWKHYASALHHNGQEIEAITAYESGIAIAEKKGDMQAAREMKVFLKRLSNKPGP